MTICHLSQSGKPVVLGGSDAIALPDTYLQAGATAIVLDQSGGANVAIFDHVLGRPMGDQLSGVILADGVKSLPLDIEDLYFFMK
jgi:hypothetical protein